MSMLENNSMVSFKHLSLPLKTSLTLTDFNDENIEWKHCTAPLTSLLHIKPQWKLLEIRIIKD